MTAPLPDKLITLIQEESSKAAPAGLNLLVETILERYGETVQAVLFYGSCMRAGQEKEGIVDLYVIVDTYQSAYGHAGLALLNWLLPPNVFYLEVPDGGGVIRTKYAVLTLADFQRGTSTAWFHSYLWARFAQPVRLLYARSEKTAQQIHAALARAVVTFSSCVLPQISSPFSARELWCGGLFLSYRSELRAETQDQPIRLFDEAQAYYDMITPNAMAAVPFEVEVILQSNPVGYRSNISASRRFFNRLAWQTRRVQGKGLSVLRLVKALFTFKGGLDYILWKIERHSGVGIADDSVLRRHPLSGVWVVFWRLYRRGGFR
jgi:predicted nucleotidyltransferase